MIDPFLHIRSHTRAVMVEQIMSLIGRGSSDPVTYRRTLESFDDATLQRTLNELMDGHVAREANQQLLNRLQLLPE